MTTIEKKKDFVLGGSFLIEDHPLSEVFTPEDLNDEQRLMAQSFREFVDKEVMTKLEEMEKGKLELNVDLMKQAGDLGFLAAEVPEEFDGLDVRKTTTAVLSEQVAHTGGFAVTFMAHTGIGTMPITYFGTQEQKEKYLPKLGSGELIGAYCLSESTSASDALNAKTRAVLSEDGKHYIINGAKMWISNAGFADLFIVFAKIDGKDFTAFIVERETEGVGFGAEEKKMGIKSSSTRRLILENVKVPVENVLGEIGKGHKIAFFTLNIGRYKLGAASVGGSKDLLEQTARYAKERTAFGKSISDFGMIKHKIGEMVIRIFGAESMVYRAAGYMDSMLKDAKEAEVRDEAKIMKSIEEYAIECAMAKVYGSEVLDYVVDEAMQTLAGYGYSAEYPVERAYRDARINRIFEGTNEINRMLMIQMLMKRAMTGELPLMQKAQALMGELMGMPSFNFDTEEGLFVEEKKLVENAKKAVLFLSGAAVQKFMADLEHQQELLGMAADILTETFVMESMLLRALKKVEREGEDAAKLMILATEVYCHDAIERIATWAKTGLAAIADGDMLMTMNAALRRLMKHPSVNTIEKRRILADAAVTAGGYPFPF